MASTSKHTFTARPARDDDRFTLTPSAALYISFLNAGYCSDDAGLLADYALAHPHKLLEDCKPSIAHEWRAAIAKAKGGAA